MTDLERLFSEINRTRFAGCLPAYRVRRVHGLGDPGRCDGRRHMILVRADLTGERLRKVLAHEMCHVGLESEPVKHGPAFLRRLESLVAQGEPLEEELAWYRLWPPGYLGAPLEQAAHAALESLLRDRPRGNGGGRRGTSPIGWICRLRSSTADYCGSRMSGLGDERGNVCCAKCGMPLAGAVRLPRQRRQRLNYERAWS